MANSGLVELQPDAVDRLAGEIETTAVADGESLVAMLDAAAAVAAHLGPESAAALRETADAMAGHLHQLTDEAVRVADALRARAEMVRSADADAADQLNGIDDGER